MSSFDLSLPAKSDMVVLLDRLVGMTTSISADLDSYWRDSGTGCVMTFGKKRGYGLVVGLRRFSPVNAVLDAAHDAFPRACSASLPYTKHSSPSDSLTDRLVLVIAFWLNVPSRIALARTSRRIRALLVSEHRLWSTLRYTLQADGREIPLLASLMQLASPRLVSLGITAHAFAYGRVPQLGKFVKQHIPRISQLQIDLCCFNSELSGGRSIEELAEIWTDLFGALERPVPSLQALRLSMDLIRSGVRREKSYVLYLPVKDLFSGQHPSLRKLHLRSIYLRLEPGIPYPSLRQLVSLTYTSPGLDLTEAQLELLLEQAPQLIYLGLALRSYVVLTDLPMISSATTESSKMSPTPSQIKLSGFIVGSKAILSRFASCTAISARFHLPIESQHLEPWVGTSLKLVALGYSKVPSGTLHKLPRPYSDSQQLIVFFALRSTLNEFAASHLVSELSLSESHWEWFTGKETFHLTLPSLKKLSIVLSTCIDAHRHAGALWQREQQMIYPPDPPFPALKVMCIIAVHNTAAFNSMNSCNVSAHPSCPYFGTCRLSLRDVSKFLRSTLADVQQLESLDLVGVTDIVDVDLDAAWRSIIDHTQRLEFHTPEVVPLENAGRVELGHCMSEAYPALDGSNIFMSDYQVRLNQ